ncbi:MAG: TatD family hydrolase, partial [Chitinophagaceae bacterium]
KFYLPNIDLGVIPDMLALETAYPGQCMAMMGLHPCSVKANYKDELAVMREWLDKRKFAAIGEVGLDFFWDTSFEKEQFEAFHIQAEWAQQFALPLVIHSRKSMDECISLIQEHQDGSMNGIFHCFSGTLEQAQKIINLGFYLGIGGVVTYKNGGLEPVIKEIGLNRVVLETDAPYLTPVPFRGKRNEPAYLKYVVEKLAIITGNNMEAVATITTENAEKVFSQSRKD